MTNSKQTQMNVVKNNYVYCLTFEFKKNSGHMSVPDTSQSAEGKFKKEKC